MAYDLYAQADDGSVWYFGEDVADIENGTIVTKEGTWLAGKDGPAQMIMPADPSVGDVYRTENIPGIAFEQVTVKSVDTQLAGPLGPVHGMVGAELHEDGSTELKQFARGYGEYFTGDQGDVEALALAVPTDASEHPLPAGLGRLYADARNIVRTGPDPAAAKRLTADWSTVPRDDTPRLMVPVVTRAIRAVSGAPHPTVARQERHRPSAAGPGPPTALPRPNRGGPGTGVPLVRPATAGRTTSQRREHQQRRVHALLPARPRPGITQRRNGLGLQPRARRTPGVAIDHDSPRAARAAHRLQIAIDAALTS